MSVRASTRPVRVLIVHPSTDLYGSDRVVLATAVALQRSGCRVVLILPGDGPLVGAATDLGIEVQQVANPPLRRSFFSVRGLPRLAYGLVRATPQMIYAVRRNEPDVILVNTVTLPHWILLGRIARRATICHLHESEEVATIVHKALAAPLLLANAIVVNADNGMAWLHEAFPVLARRAIRVYNGFPDVPNVPDEPHDGFVMALVGRISPRKGTAVALEALAELLARGVDARLVLAGDSFDGYEWFLDEIRARSAKADLAGRVTFTGFVDDPSPVYAGADVVIVPSSVESFGNVAVEAALACRPVVASCVGGLREIVQPDTGRLVPPGDAVALAEAVAALAGDPAGCRALGRAARASARARFGVDAFEAGMVGVVHSQRRTRRWRR